MFRRILDLSFFLLFIILKEWSCACCAYFFFCLLSTLHTLYYFLPFFFYPLRTSFFSFCLFISTTTASHTRKAAYLRCKYFGYDFDGFLVFHVYGLFSFFVLWVYFVSGIKQSIGYTLTATVQPAFFPIFLYSV
jgi:hypothetical protein